MRKTLAFLIYILLLFGCNQFTKSKEQGRIVEDNPSDSTTQKTSVNTTVVTRDSLIGIHDFEEVIGSIENVENTNDQHKDWMFNRARTLKPLIELDYDEFKVKSTSFIYQDECVFYVHNIKHSNDSISIKPFIENAQGKRTEGYTQVRVLIFAMKNEKEANFIDIPIVYNNTQLDNELIQKVYSEIDFKVIACDSMQVCRMKYPSN